MNYRIVRDSDFQFTDPRRLIQIKLYGNLGQSDMPVVTKDDHYGLWRNRDWDKPIARNSACFTITATVTQLEQLRSP